MTLRLLPIYALLCLALFSCSKPVKSFCFKELDPEYGLNSAVTFSLEINDTIDPQQMDLSARLSDYNDDENGEIPLILQITSPSGAMGCDTLCLLFGKRSADESIIRNNGHITINRTYRKNIIIRESGVWNFSISPYKEKGSNHIFKKITGLGIFFKKEER